MNTIQIEKQLYTYIVLILASISTLISHLAFKKTMPKHLYINNVGCLKENLIQSNFS